MASKYLLGSILGLALAVAGESPARGDDGPRARRSEAVGFATLSGTMAVAGFALPVPAPYVVAFQMSASAPLLAVSNTDAALNGTMQAGFLGSTVGLGLARQNNATWTPYYTLAGELSLHQAIYATYATYRDFRARGQESGDGDTFQPVSGEALMLAPFRASSYRHRIVYASLIVEGALAGLAGVGAFATGTGRWSGPHFARDFPIGLALSLDAGVTEEAFDRGFVYEELKGALPKWPARMVDMAFFAALHVPGELDTQSSSQILIGFGVRAFGALLMDVAYDEGGLRESVALHAAYDGMLFTLAAVTGQSVFGNSVSSLFAPSGRTARTSTAPVLVPLFSTRF